MCFRGGLFLSVWDVISAGGSVMSSASLRSRGSA